MYLTHIIHDFDFDLETYYDETLHTLEFKRSGVRIWPPLFGRKITFNSNQGRDVYLLENKTPLTRESYTFVVGNVVAFTWKRGEKVIRYKALRFASARLIRYWLLHTLLPLYYSFEEIYKMLHVGSVEVHGKACLFAAPSFGGKSTLTHYFLQKGHRLLSDDTLAFYRKGHQHYAVSSYPFSRSYRNIEDLGDRVKNFVTRPIPIERIYRLIQIDPCGEISIRALSGVEKFSVIEMCRDIKIPEMDSERLAEWIDFTQKIPVFEITIPQDKKRLEEVYRAIIDAVENH